LEKDPEKAIVDNDVIFIAVGTPSKGDGDVDLSYLEEGSKKCCDKKQRT
jgi:UDP-glucose 6-dehydrogenase